MESIKSKFSEMGASSPRRRRERRGDAEIRGEKRKIRGEKDRKDLSTPLCETSTFSAPLR